MDEYNFRNQIDTEQDATSTEVFELKKENDKSKQIVAALSLKKRVLKNLEWSGIRGSRGCGQSEIVEIIWIVEESELFIKQTLDERNINSRLFG